ncbi:MAG: hypothetical protein ACREHG_02385, partial [Candidatus Saccharimonadales bacterium]
VTCGLAAPAIALWLASMAITSSAVVGVLTATMLGAIAGGVMGAGMTALNGGSLGDILSAGFKGAAIGAFAGAATWGAGYISAGWGFVGQAFAHGVAGGLTGMVSGGSFQKGFELAVLAYGAFSLYRHFVQEKPKWESPEWKGGDHVYWKENADPFQEIQSHDNFGTAHINFLDAGEKYTGSYGWWDEGGALSKALDMYPGMNALATLHDVWGDLIERSFGSFPSWASYGSMLPAAAVTYTALVNTPIGAAIVASDVDHNNYGGP